MSSQFQMGMSYAVENDGPSVTSYQGGLNLRDPEGRLKGHVGVTATPDAVKLDLQHYTADGSGLVTAFHTITAREARELAFALQRAVEATEAGRRYSQATERVMERLGVSG